MFFYALKYYEDQFLDKISSPCYYMVMLNNYEDFSVKNILIGIVIGFLLSTLGFTGVSKLFDKGIETAKVRIKESVNE